MSYLRPQCPQGFPCAGCLRLFVTETFCSSIPGRAVQGCLRCARIGAAAATAVRMWGSGVQTAASAAVRRELSKGARGVNDVSVDD